MAEQNSIPARPGDDRRPLVSGRIKAGAVVDKVTYSPLPPAGTPARRRIIAIRGW
jgi:hypothetical protein